MQLALLWTDFLVLFLVAATLMFVWFVRSHEHLLTPWRYVGQRPMAMVALVVLLSFVLIGVLDSLHFKVQNGHGAYTGRVVSVLDKILAPLDTQYERTYSAPFSLYSFSKSTQKTPEGEVRTYARLAHAGQSLVTPDEKIQDIVVLGFAGIAMGAFFAVISAFLLALIGARFNLRRASHCLAVVMSGESAIAWRAMFVTFMVLCLLGGIALSLVGHYHIFGTDKVGKDVFFEAVKSIRTGLIIGTITTLVMLPFAILLGSAAGYFRGWVDDVIQYLYTTLSSVPGVLLISAAVLSLQVYISNNAESFPTLASRADARLLALCLILGITSWTGLCRLLRAETLKLREMDFVRAAQSMGVTRWRIISRHVVPNIMHIVLITVVLDFSGLVLAEAVLSYVGVGVDPTTLSWGNMINSARLDLAREPTVWWPLMAAFVFMFTLVLSANLFSDAVRDAFDPRLRHAE